MEIKTPFSLGDNVYLLCDNKIQKSEIRSIYMTANRTQGANFRYELSGIAGKFSSDELFASKEALVLSLLGAKH